MAKTGDPRIAVGRLHDFVTATFAAAGCSEDEAKAVATFLVDANLAGHDSHGVGRVPRYLHWMKEGTVRPGRTATLVADAGALSVMDGNFGFGATIGREAVLHGIEKAKAGGVAIVALRSSGHLGRIGQWAELALEHGIVSLHIVNAGGSMLVAPFGGVDKRFSTAPIAFGFPLPGEPPVVLDFATSAVAEGKVMVASNGGKALPPDVLIDEDGRLSNDPATLYGPLVPGGLREHQFGTGAIRAMGEHKGSGLALMCELLGGVLTGSGCAGPPRDQPFANGMVSIYMSPAHFGSEDAMARETRSYIDFVRSSRPAVPGQPVLLPGEPERIAQADRTANGVPIPREAWLGMMAAARSVGLGANDPRMLPEPPAA
ncbi:malate/lactate/ureidoglycolate dehydrogenase [Enterovirga rhinocerotis]|uniref:Putative oxidoreductase n=1 Tax=Enterovirga rhinocerotis TaxID=1339210 RepID=A0A4R7C7T5_9HYPH|nr:malate/lactate/ureidoglycolate dehydrogenase [Enterovirga rhinocerotis]TDR94032.1 putative oxidoreductase [Enterovirga rhinocerotis]